MGTLLCLVITSLSFGQETAKQAISKAQEFSTSSGKLIEKEWTRIGWLNDMKFSAVRYKDLISEKSISAMRVEMEVKGKYTTDSKISEIDKDEIDGLLRSLEIIKREVTTTTREQYTEIVFTSRSGFQAGCYYETDDAKWSLFVKIERFDKDSYVFMSAEDLDSLIELVKGALSKMP